MLKRTLTSVAIVLITLLFFYLRTIHYKLFDLFVYAIAIISTCELLGAYKDGISKLQKILVLIFTVIIFPIASFLPSLLIHCFAGYVSILIFVTVLTSDFEAKGGLTKTVFATFYPTIPLLSMILLNINDRRAVYMLAIALTVPSFTDVFAYLIGSWLKGPKLSPRLSPKKTISGAVGGLVGGVIATFLSYFGLKQLNIDVFSSVKIINVVIFLLVSGIFLSVIAQLGDLTESYIKRRFNIKDSGKIIPGHGGMLDRIDSVTFVSLFTYIIYSLIL
ncbi:MAG: CDP-archaeol synthase [Clostridia bacterium]|nr:CDP-archaeol synthase [Clostridia bacterium]